MEEAPQEEISGSMAAQNAPFPDGYKIGVKAGTSLLTLSNGNLNLEVMSVLVRQIAEMHRLGAKVTLITSGAIGAGRNILGAGARR